MPAKASVPGGVLPGSSVVRGALEALSEHPPLSRPWAAPTGAWPPPTGPWLAPTALGTPPASFPRPAPRGKGRGNMSPTVATSGALSTGVGAPL